MFTLSSILTAQADSPTNNPFIFNLDQETREERNPAGYAWSMLTGFLETAAALYLLERGPGFISRWAKDDVLPFGTIFSILGAGIASGSSLLHDFHHPELLEYLAHGAIGAASSIASFALFMKCIWGCSFRHKPDYALQSRSIGGNQVIAVIVADG